MDLKEKAQSNWAIYAIGIIVGFICSVLSVLLGVGVGKLLVVIFH